MDREAPKERAMATKTPKRSDLLSLSVPERILLVEDLWDSIAAVPEEVPLSDRQKAELDRRLHAYRRTPGRGSSWEAVLKRLRNRP
jgi:putative addiction module component (TIGR02574 family)